MWKKKGKHLFIDYHEHIITTWWSEIYCTNTQINTQYGFPFSLTCCISSTTRWCNVIEKEELWASQFFQEQVEIFLYKSPLWNCLMKVKMPHKNNKKGWQKCHVSHPNSCNRESGRCHHVQSHSHTCVGVLWMNSL